MAFSGLPSKACANCRLRRIKCNLAEPECAQCRRAGKVCPGYRDQLALLFRDENAKVIRKARGRPALVEEQKSKEVEGEDKLADTDNLNPLQITIPCKLETLSNAFSPSITIFRNLLSSSHDPGINFFFHQYMTSSSQPDIFSSQIWQGVSQHKPFLDSISCVGLAGLSNVNNDQRMMSMAREKYAVTVRRVVAALQVPESADMGYTLKSVMMLVLFEMINCDLPTAGLWGIHLDGIAALLNSESFKKFEKMFPVRIKYQFFFAMFMKHIQTGQKFPASMTNWSRIWGAALCETDAPVASLTEIIIQFIDLNASVRQGEAVDANAIIRDALLLDNALEEWKTALPPTWKYRVVISPKAQGTYDGQYHTYSDQWTARMWDHYRWTRILVHDLVLTHLTLLPSLPAGMHKQQAQSLAIISYLASRICASVSSQLYRPDPIIPGVRPNCELTSVFMLLWPLKVAGSAIGVPDALHEWVLDVLKNIGQAMGIGQTKVVIFKTKAQRDYWKGNGAFVSRDGIYTS